MKRKLLLSDFLWRLSERWSAQLITLIVSIILARLLDPTSYGTVAIVTAITALLSLVIDSGFGMALVQKKDADDLDFSTVFYFNIFVSAVLYVGMFLFAPLIAKLYNNPELTLIVRVQSCLLLSSGFSSVQTAFVTKHMLFKKMFQASFCGTMVGAGVGVSIALLGGGVWALVIQSLSSSFINTVLLWIIVKWYPQKKFSFVRLKSLFSYGWKLLMSSVMFSMYSNLRQLFIGKFYTPADLAYYNKAANLPTMVNSGVSSSIGSVIFPSMSMNQQDLLQIKRMLRRTILLHSYILMPVFFGMLACARPIIILLFSEKWLPAVPYLQLLCLEYLFEGLGIANQNAIKAIGYTNITLKIECIKTPMYIAIFLATLPHGVLAIATGVATGTILAELLCALPAKRLFGYSVLTQLFDVLPHLLLSACMGGVVWCVTLLKLPLIITLIIQVLLGVSLYIGGSILFHIESFYYVLAAIKSIGKDKGEK